VRREEQENMRRKDNKKDYVRKAELVWKVCGKPPTWRGTLMKLDIKPGSYPGGYGGQSPSTENFLQIARVTSD